MSQNEENGFQRIGSLTPRIADTLRNSASTQMKSPRSSATGGMPRQGLMPLSSTGTSLGRPGAAGTALAKQSETGDPATNDKMLQALLPRSVGRSLTSVNRISDGPYGFDSKFIGWKLETSVDPAELEVARELVAAALEPVDTKTLMAELAHLRAVTARRAVSEDDEALGFAVFREELSRYPADVIRSVLRGIARTSKFFPSLAEVYQACESAVKPRRLLADTLNGYPRDERRQIR